MARQIALFALNVIAAVNGTVADVLNTREDLQEGLARTPPAVTQHIEQAPSMAADGPVTVALDSTSAQFPTGKVQEIPTVDDAPGSSVDPEPQSGNDNWAALQKLNSFREWLETEGVNNEEVNRTMLAYLHDLDTAGLDGVEQLHEVNTFLETELTDAFAAAGLDQDLRRDETGIAIDGAKPSVTAPEAVTDGAVTVPLEPPVMGDLTQPPPPEASSPRLSEPNAADIRPPDTADIRPPDTADIRPPDTADIRPREAQPEPEPH